MRRCFLAYSCACISITGNMTITSTSAASSFTSLSSTSVSACDLMYLDGCHPNTHLILGSLWDPLIPDPAFDRQFPSYWIDRLQMALLPKSGMKVRRTRKCNVIMKYRRGQPNWEYMMWKFQEFSATQILREINFGYFEAPKNCHFDHFDSSEFLIFGY